MIILGSHMVNRVDGSVTPIAGPESGVAEESLLLAKVPPGGGFGFFQHERGQEQLRESRPFGERGSFSYRDVEQMRTPFP